MPTLEKKGYKWATDFTSKEPEKEQTESKVSRRKEIIKFGTEINKIENRKTIEK